MSVTAPGSAPVAPGPASAAAPAAVDRPAPEYLEAAGFRRLTVDEYHQMIRAGVLVDGEPVELLEGWMIKKMAHGVRHDSVMDALEAVLPGLLPADWFVRCQRAVTLPDSEPEPDYAVVRGPRTRYRERHPGPGDIGLVIEVADSSLPLDRQAKGRIYARAAIPVYWIVNLPERRVEVYTAPSGPAAAEPAYACRQDYVPGSAVPVELDGTLVGSLPVADFLD